MNDIKLVERTVKHKVVTYHVEKEGVKADGSLGTVVVERQARRGDKIELREPEANVLDDLGAFYTDAEIKQLAEAGLTVGDTAPPAPPVGDTTDLADMSVEEITAWLQGEGPGSKPSVPQALNAVNSAPEDSREEVAQKVLEAEQARDGDPRSTLVGPLEEFLAGDGED